MPYLKKLSLADVQLGPNMWIDFFPELSKSVNGASTRLQRYREVWLLELEKLLRRLRILSLRTDRMSDSLIKKIRRFTERKQDGLHSLPAEIKGTTGIKNQGLMGQVATEDTVGDMKKEEQRLIIEIAKNPKNSSLYEVLGDLYMKMSNFADAKESYEAAMELNPAKEELVKKHSQAVESMVK